MFHIQKFIGTVKKKLQRKQEKRSLLFVLKRGLPMQWTSNLHQKISAGMKSLKWRMNHAAYKYLPKKALLFLGIKETAHSHRGIIGRIQDFWQHHRRATIAVMALAGIMIPLQYMMPNGDNLQASLIDAPEISEEAPGELTVVQTLTDINGGSTVSGDILSIEITITNDTNASVTGGNLTMLLPAGSLYTDGSFTLGGVAQSPVESGTSTHTSLSFSLPDMNTGDSLVVNYESVVQDGILLMTDNAATPPIVYRMNTTTGSATYLGNMTGQERMYATALSQDQGTLYGVNRTTGDVSSLDLYTGTVNILGNLGLPSTNIQCASFASNGNLYGLDGSEHDLVQIDINTGVGTKLYDLDMEVHGGGCTFAPDGTLYTLSNTNAGKGALWTVNISDGSVKKVANVSDTDYFSGIALLDNGNMYASSKDTDGLWSVNTADGTGSSLGSFGVPHDSGDLSSTSALGRMLIAGVTYTDDDSRSITESDLLVMPTANSPTVGSGPDIRPQVLENTPTEEPDPCEDETPSVAVETCVLDGSFTLELNQYRNDRMLYHFTEAEKVAGDEIQVRELTGDDVQIFLGRANGVIVTHRNNAQSNTDTQILNWKNTHNGTEGACPNDNPLRESISQTLTQYQSSAEVAIRQIGSDSGTESTELESILAADPIVEEPVSNEPEVEYTPPALACSLSAQNTNIRIGDSLYLGWSTTDATVTDINGTSVSTSGTLQVSPTQTTTYTLTATNDEGGSVTCEKTVNVSTACDIWPASNAIEIGTSTTLYWNAAGNDVAEITSLGGVGLTDSLVITPTVDTTYTMGVYKDGVLQQTCSTTIYVSEEPC